MRPEFIPVGQIVNAHGIRGEVKLNPAGFDPAFLAAFDTLYIGGKETKVKSARVHKSTVLLALPDADLADAAAESARTRTELGLYERPEGADTAAGEAEA